MKKNCRTAIALVCLSATTAAFADDSGWYVAAGLGGTDVSSLNYDTQSSMIAAGNTRFTNTANLGMGSSKVSAGYQFNKHWAIEAGYVRLGKYTYAASGGNMAAPYSLSSTIKAAYLDAVVILPLENSVSFYAKLGASHSTSSSVAGLAPSFVGAKKTAVTTGLGVKYEFENGISIHYESESYDVGATNLVYVGTFGLGYKF